MLFKAGRLDKSGYLTAGGEAAVPAPSCTHSGRRGMRAARGRRYAVGREAGAPRQVHLPELVHAVLNVYKAFVVATGGKLQDDVEAG